MTARLGDKYIKRSVRIDLKALHNRAACIEDRVMEMNYEITLIEQAMSRLEKSEGDAREARKKIDSLRAALQELAERSRLVSGNIEEVQ